MVRVYEIYKSNCLSFAASKSIESNGGEGGEGVSACKVVMWRVKKRIKPRQKCKTLQLLKRTEIVSNVSKRQTKKNLMM